MERPDSVEIEPAKDDDEARADAVISADDTGMLGDEQAIVSAEIEKALEE